MAQCTSVFVKHNIDMNNLDTIKADLEKRFNTTFFYTELTKEFNYNPPIPEDYDGWVIYCDPYLPAEMVGSYYYDFVHIGSQKSLNIGRNYVELTFYCVDYFGEWWSVPYWLDAVYPEANAEYLQERKNIYEAAKLFGATECIMCNGERLALLCEYLDNGLSMEEAIAKYELSNPPKKVKKYGSHSDVEIYIEDPCKITVLSPHELDPRMKYIDSNGWYDTIIIDDFRDLKVLPT